MTRKLFLSLSIALMLAGCRSSKPAAPADSASAPAPAVPVTVYSIRGKILSIHGSDVMLDHEAIPGFMEAMTMSYKLKDPSIVSELHPGDRITGSLLVSKDADGFNTVLLDKIVVIAQAKPDYKPAVQYHVPQPGDTVPDFKLVNQNGHSIQLSQFYGKAVLLTFIYTRCPLADFCPRMSHNFAEVNQALAADPTLYAKTHLLSVSFDPAYDTPAVLRSYGEAYIDRGRSPANAKSTQDRFSHWDFAAPSEKDVDALTQFFDVGTTPGDDKSINHTLSTVLLGKDGRVIAWYHSNDWKPGDVVAQLKRAAA